MSNEPFGEFTHGAVIAGVFAKDYRMTLHWLPEYIDEFPEILANINLKWEKCKFVKAGQMQIPQKFGVYCFTVDLGPPFPIAIHLPLYIGKASDQYLCERYKDYLAEKQSLSGRKNIVAALNKYKNRIYFWWATLDYGYADAVEKHLLMCCETPCNEKKYNREMFWGKAFSSSVEGDI